MAAWMKFNRDFFRRLWILFKPYWVYSDERRKAYSLLAVILLFTCLQVYCTVLLNSIYKDFYDALQAINAKALMYSLGQFVSLVIFLIFFSSYALYFMGLLVIRWRRWMTQYFTKEWFLDDRFYQMQVLGLNVDNPDQRINEDLSTFPTFSISLIVNLLRSTLTLISFSIILWELSGMLPINIGKFHIVIPGYLFWIAIIYSVAGTYLTAYIGRLLPQLNYLQQFYNADFRFALIRIREASEQISFFKGYDYEQKNLKNIFSHVYDNFIRIISIELRLNFFLNGFSFVTEMIGICAALPLYLAKVILLGTVIQVTRAFGNVTDALSIFMQLFTNIAEWYAAIYRLTEFKQKMEQTSQATREVPLHFVKPEQGKALKISELTVKLPNQSILLKDLNLKIENHEKLLIMGRSGSGKSTLMRVVGHIWPFAEGKIEVPAHAKFMFLPQRPYFPLDSLKAAVCYPQDEKKFSDDDVREVLVACGLPYLANQLSNHRLWGHELSWGEQQLVAIARVLVQKPDWLFMDEATSALDDESEARVFKLMNEYVPNLTLISIGHRHSLKQWHQQVLTLQRQPV